MAQALDERGAELRLLVRSKSRRDNLEGLRGDIVIGDVREPESLRTGMEGCEAVFHVAADYRLWTRDPQEMYASNVEGTEGLIKAAQQAGVRRVVYTSSVATMGFQAEAVVVNEQTPVTLANMIGDYKKSKFMAEQKALEAARNGADVVIVNPSTPIGERDIKPTPTGRIVVDFLKRKFPAYVHTGLNLVDVRDCALGHVAAFEHGRSGERYILGGENLTLKQILDKLGGITGLPSPTIKVPYAVAFMTAVVDTTWTGMLMNREPRATIDAVRMGRKMMFVSSDKAERELGWKAGGVDEALRRAAEWFTAHGYAPAYGEMCVNA